MIVYNVDMCDPNAELQKAKSKVQNSNNIREEANICNQLGELLSRNGKWFILLTILNRLLVKGLCADCFYHMT